jgi:hypothetical protein
VYKSRNTRFETLSIRELKVIMFLRNVIGIWPMAVNNFFKSILWLVHTPEIITVLHYWIYYRIESCGVV